MWLALVCAFNGCLVAQAEATQDPSAMVRAVLGLYEENRAKFPHGVITFSYSDGFAKDPASARRGALTDGHTAVGTYAYAKGAAAYMRVFPVDDLEKATRQIEGNQYMARFDTVRAATDGARSIVGRTSATLKSSQRLSDSVSISLGEGDFYREAIVPLSLQASLDERTDYPILLRQVADGTKGYRVLEMDEKASLDSRSLLRMVVQLPVGVSTFWFDLECGGIPRRYQYKGETNRVVEQFLDDLRLIPGYGWYPHVMTTILPGGRAQRLEVTSADFKRQPHEKDFVLDFDHPVEVADLAKGLSYPPQQFWDLAALPRLGEPGVARFVTSPAVAPSMPGERKEDTLIRWLITALAAALVAGAIVLWARGRRVARGGS